MIRFEIHGQSPDMAYDYGHLLKTFNHMWASDATYLFVQSIDTNGHTQIEGELYNPQGELVAASGLKSDALLMRYGTTFDLKVLLKHNLYQVLSQVEVSSNPYGILVGIRPVKLVHEWLIKGKSESEISLILKGIYGVLTEKIELMLQIAKAELPIILDQSESDISLYICIPFCRTRCLYCSFPANSVKQKGHLMSDYVKALIKEIRATAEDLTARGMRVDCLYIGGGTPTALEDDQFALLLETVVDVFDTKHFKEFTVEAGRPDTFTTAKLEAMVNAGVDRICLNPQTMCDQTLKAIGRDHTAEDVISQYRVLKSLSPAAVNMDLIAGLDVESVSEMAYTVDEVLKLRPENITLHTLALKRASRLNEEKDKHVMQHEDEVAKMVDYAYKSFVNAGYEPYYMYRQKQMIGNLENIGFSLPGHIGLYNVRIMEEKHSIIALGAGAVSKIYFPEENRLERFSNSKGLEDYLNRVDEMIAKRNDWLTSRYDLPIMK